jgi:hypothetical protein
MSSSMIAGVAMKKIRDTRTEEPKSFLNIPNAYKANEANRRRRLDPTLMVMSVMGGVGMGLIGLLSIGQL